MITTIVDFVVAVVVATMATIYSLILLFSICLSVYLRMRSKDAMHALLAVAH